MKKKENASDTEITYVEPESYFPPEARKAFEDALKEQKKKASKKSRKSATGSVYYEPAAYFPKEIRKIFEQEEGEKEEKGKM